MYQTMIDAEKLAALLDGRLDADERVELLASLSDSDAAFEVYTEATALTLELEAEDRATGAIPLGPRGVVGRRARPALMMLALAAGLGGIVALQGVGSGDEADLSAGTFIALAGDGVGWGERPDSGWPVLRAGSVATSAPSAALRLGAELAWLRVALDSGDHGAIRQAATTIDSLLDRMPGAAPLAALYRNIADEAERPSSDLRLMVDEAAAATRGLSGGELITLGAWLEMGRVALGRGNIDYFASATTETLIDATESSGVVPAIAVTSLREINSAAREGRDAVIRAELDRLPLLLETTWESLEG